MTTDAPCLRKTSTILRWFASRRFGPIYLTSYGAWQAFGASMPSVLGARSACRSARGSPIPCAHTPLCSSPRALPSPETPQDA
jgi:hypothetical protein